MSRPQKAFLPAGDGPADEADEAEQAQWRVAWFDSGCRARYRDSRSQRDFPNGIDLNPRWDPNTTCRVVLPYPTTGMGYYTVVCNICGVTKTIATNGQRDDPRSARIACRRL